MTVIKDVKVNIKLNNPNIKSSINTPNISLKASVNTPSTLFERDYNNLLNLPQINSVTLKGNLSPEDLNMTTSQLLNDGEGSSPFVNETELNELRQELDDLITEVIDEGINVIREDIRDIEEEISGVDTELNSHINNLNNPHQVTKSQIGLSEVDNTSDMNKPISTAVQNQLNVINNEIDEIEFDLAEHIGNFENPHQVTKNQIGLNNVDNTSDLDKPISTLTQNALNRLSDDLANEINRSTSKDDEIDETLQNEMNTRVEEHAEIQNDIDKINAKIPIQASSTNQLADKDFVNSTINSSVATFRGNFATKAALDAWQLANPSVAKNNDYCYVEQDETRNNESWRYIYVVENGVGSWQAQFKVNDTPFTAEQLAAINSGATAQIINSISSKLTASDILDSTGDSSLKAISQRAATLAAQSVQTNLNSHINDNNNPHQVNKSQIGLSNVDNTSDANKPISNATQTALNGKLSLSGGTLTGTLYSKAATPLYIGYNGKVGMRAVVEGDSAHKGQMNISSAWYDSQHYGAQMSARNEVTGKYNAIRISHDGPQYFDEDDAPHDIALKEEIPTNNNQLTNGAGYITSSGSISGTAGNANKLNNQDASYYLNYNNFTNKPTIDSALSTSSTNAVQNKVITEALDAKLNTDGGTIENGLRVKKLSDTPLTLQTKDSNACYIEFADMNGTTLGYYGVNSSKQPVFYLNGDRRLAFKDEIPSSASFVDLISNQTISGNKTFIGTINVPDVTIT